MWTEKLLITNGDLCLKQCLHAAHWYFVREVRCMKHYITAMQDQCDLEEVLFLASALRSSRCTIHMSCGFFALSSGTLRRIPIAIDVSTFRFRYDAMTWLSKTD